MTKKNIWLWNHYATNMYFDEGGRHYWFAKYLIEDGYGATIFAANTKHNSSDVIDTGRKKYTVKETNGIPFVFVKTTHYKGNGISRVLNMIRFAINLYFVAKSYAKTVDKPDVILASSVHPLTLVAGIFAGKRLNVPCICEVRDLWPEAIFMFGKVKEQSLLGRLLKLGEYWIYKKADALIFTKEGDSDYLREKGWTTEQGGKIDLNKVHYINNGVDLVAFNNSIKEHSFEDEDLKSNKFNVVYVGAIRPVNNVGNILDTAILLKDEKDIQILIYGDGNQREILEERVSEEELINVKIKGFINKKHIPYILSKSSVNLLNYSSTQYNWTRGNSSNKLFEYMASGKPVISTVKMGYSIIEKYKCGIELEESTPKELSTAILRIKKMNKEQYEQFGNNAKIGAKDFDFEVLSDKLIDVIHSFAQHYK